MAKKISDYPAKTSFNDTDLYDCSTDDLTGGYVSQKVTYLQLRNNIFGIRFDQTYNETIISQLNTLNSGFGETLLAAPGANKTYHLLTDIILIWDIVGDTFTDANLDVYSHDENTQIGKVPLVNAVILPRKFIQIMELKNESILGINQALMLWASVQQSNIAEGTLRIIFDYEILDV